MHTFLESYISHVFIPTEFIVTGFSLGGHCAWDALAKIQQIKAGVVLMGSPNLAAMLVERLGAYKSVSKEPLGSKEWPKCLESLYLARDKSLESISGKRILILTGALDELVPGRFTIPWVHKCAANNDVKFVQAEQTGHWVSWRMMEAMIDWDIETVK